MLYKITGFNRESINGGGMIWPDLGVWTKSKPVVLCRSGYHLSTQIGLSDWLNLGYLWEAEGEGFCQHSPDGDKVVFERARLVRKVGTISKDLIVEWFVSSAMRMLKSVDARSLENFSLIKEGLDTLESGMDEDSLSVYKKMCKIPWEYLEDSTPPHPSTTRVVYINSYLAGAVRSMLLFSAKINSFDKGSNIFDAQIAAGRLEYASMALYDHIDHTNFKSFLSENLLRLVKEGNDECVL